MIFAFAIFKYFPHGGLQRDFRRILEACLAHGHRVDVYARCWEGEPPPDGATLRLLPAGFWAWSNHARARDFERRFTDAVRDRHYDAIVGFNRMRGLDLYFAADDCQAAEMKAWQKFLFPRHRVYSNMERAVFSPTSSHAEILCLTERQKQDFERIYHTPETRFHLLPPGIDPARKRPDDEAAVQAIRRRVRAEFGIGDTQRLLIQVCSGFATKGVDRVLELLTAFPQCRYLVAGCEKSERFQKLARQLNVAGQVIWAGPCDNVGELLLAADLMIHPARKESAGTVLAEALAAGLPVLTTERCGYAPLVQAAGGCVLPEPYEKACWKTALTHCLNGLPAMAEAAKKYGRTADFYRRAEVAAKTIEETAQCVGNRSI